MATGLLHAHSGLRYLVLLAGVAVVCYSLYGLITGRAYDRAMRATAASFAGLLHLQVLLGFFLLVSGRFYPQLIGHIFLMLAAAVAAQVPLSVFRRRPPEERTYAPHLVSSVVALLLIWFGVLAINRTLLGAGF